jgi:hypothetical protein
MLEQSVLVEMPSGQISQEVQATPSNSTEQAFRVPTELKVKVSDSTQTLSTPLVKE